MMKSGVPIYTVDEYRPKEKDYCVLIPIINEKGHIEKELKRALDAKVYDFADIVICDGGSTDGCTDKQELLKFNVNTLLVKNDKGKQGAQLRMGFDWALNRGYKGFITVDGNNKDSIEDVPHFIEKLEEGYDFIQGSRFIKGGKAINTPLFRLVSVKMIHAPIISLTARKRYTDTTNAYRAYSRRYIEDPRVDVFRDIFDTYELLAYLSVRADQLKMKTGEIPVTREYPFNEKTPTKIKGFKGNYNLFKILILNMFGKYMPKKVQQ
jgi:glycosyltransferase involved in cell wall biosynthesis